MTIDDVRKQIERIRKMAADCDDESAHVQEDDLRTAVLTAIANGETSAPAALAAEVLKTADIEFARWCA